ncbi:hypothetical protein HELRODRAFT_151325, partial [Helobdella robusta]|uniref:Small RNA 2'-O-methyltransferase n=1 Tax=Helobdella robusta TaxID=6412 RepID=T1EKJ6_HELRO
IGFKPPLYKQRNEKIVEIVKSFKDLTKIIDLGCGECRLLRSVKKLDRIEQIIGIDCNKEILEDNFYSLKPLNFQYLIPRSNPLTINIFHADFLKTDLSHLRSSNQAVILSEVIEHLNENDLPRLVKVIFYEINPDIVLISTPNADFNICFNFNKSGIKFRHFDHKFEWTRAEFSNWCNGIVSRYAYNVVYDGVGLPPVNHVSVGYCTQIAIFKK